LNERSSDSAGSFFTTPSGTGLPAAPLAPVAEAVGDCGESAAAQFGSVAEPGGGGGAVTWSEAVRDARAGLFDRAAVIAFSVGMSRDVRASIGGKTKKNN
jgi:hypothetical protein